jgi:hypothetical protein
VSLGTAKDWGGSLHLTFRLLPEADRSGNLRPFLEAEGLVPNALLAKLPYDRQRSGSRQAETPDPKRYRDAKQVYQTVGLLYEDDGAIRITELGRATLRWLPIITPKNRVILARHAAYALAACQLRNPTGAGQKYTATTNAFPFSYVWRAMLALDNRISSEELNRGLFKVTNENELHSVIEAIRSARVSSEIESLGPETIIGEKKNDRIIPWVSLASFGWTLFPDKRRGEAGSYYELDASTLSVIKEAAQVRHRHREFASTKEYVEYISDCAALPKDLR